MKDSMKFHFFEPYTLKKKLDNIFSFASRWNHRQPKKALFSTSVAELLSLSFCLILKEMCDLYDRYSNDKKN